MLDSLPADDDDPEDWFDFELGGDGGGGGGWEGGGSMQLPRADSDAVAAAKRGRGSRLEKLERAERGGGAGTPHKGAGAPRHEVDYRCFVEVLWPRMTGKARHKAALKALSPSAVFQEIQSYIKGSARALDAPKGRLSREEYLYLGQKMAPNFKGLSAGEALSHVPGDVRGHRDLIYDLYEAYEEEKRGMQGFDLLDLVFHIWSRLQVCLPTCTCVAIQKRHIG